MKKGGVIFLLTVIALVLFLANGFVYVDKDHTGPVIHIPASNSEYAKNVDAKTLLDGVTATDNRDGDVSSTLRVAAIVPNSDDTKASVVYTAKDKSNNVTKVSRTITYSAQDNTTSEENAAAAAAPSNPTDSAAAGSENTAGVAESSASAADSGVVTGEEVPVENN